MTKKQVIAILTFVLLITSGFAYLKKSNLEINGVANPMFQGENEESVPLDGPLSDRIEKGVVQPAVEVSKGSKKLKDLPDQVDQKTHLMRELQSPKLGGQGNSVGPIQSTVITTSTVTLKAGFAGMSIGQGGNGWPPDTSGDVGINHYVQAVNTAVGIYDKTTGNRISLQGFNTFMQNAGQTSSTTCGTQNYGDPVVQFDTIAQKWIVMDFAFSSKLVPSYFCIAVSNNSDPTGTWHSYQLLASSTALADYPKLSVTSNGVIISANMFKNGRTYSGVNVWVLDRSSLYSSSPLKSIVYVLGNSYFSLMPVNQRFAVNAGRFSSAQSGFLLSDYGLTTSMRVFQYATPDFTTGATTNKLNQYLVPVPSSTKFTSRIPQFGGGENVDALGDRLMYAAEADDNSSSIYVSRTAVGSGSTSGIRWYQLPVNSINSINGTTAFGTAVASTYSPADGTYRWMPSLAVNFKSELAIGFSSSNPNTSFPKISAVGRSQANLGTPNLDVAEAVLKSGGGAQSGGYNRWGDYSRVSVDPVDKCTFWYSTEYYAFTGSSWQTWISPFTLTTCP